MTVYSVLKILLVILQLVGAALDLRRKSLSVAMVIAIICYAGVIAVLLVSQVEA